jgi:hypothetical protein
VSFTPKPRIAALKSCPSVGPQSRGKDVVLFFGPLKRPTYYTLSVLFVLSFSLRTGPFYAGETKSTQKKLFASARAQN